MGPLSEPSRSVLPALVPFKLARLSTERLLKALNGVKQLNVRSRKTLIYLILTLNHTYPDYDFSRLRAQHFEREPDIALVEEAVDSQLLEVSKVGLQSSQT